MRSIRSLVVFLLLVGGAGFVGSRFDPGAWYETLKKPPLTPPNWTFGVVWSALYVGIAVAAWLVWRSGKRSALPFVLWGAQLVLNATWSYLFFGLRRPGPALLEILVLLAVVVATTVSFYRLVPAAGRLFVLYAAWVTFAAYLNAGIWYLAR